MEHEIIRDHVTKRSRGFGFVVFVNEQVVDSLLSDGNMIDMAGTQVSFVQWFDMISDVLGLEDVLLINQVTSKINLKFSS